MKKLHAPPFKNHRLSIIWGAIRVLQPEEALELALVLHEMLGRGSFPTTREKDRRADALASLRQAAEKVGHSPSVREYEALRQESPELELVPSGSVRTRLAAGWNDCLKLAQLQIVPDGDLPVQRRGRFTDDEVLDALRACREAIGCVPTISTYETWASRPDVIASAKPRPRTQGPIVKPFGSWGAALKAAGIVGEAVRRGNRLDPVEWSYAVEEVIAALKLIHDRLGFSPTVAEYNLERRKWLAEQVDAGGSPQPLPSAGTIRRHFGTWSEAFAAAGLPDRRERTSRPGPKTPVFSDEVILGALRSAYSAVGEPFTRESYVLWRNERLMADPETGIPSLDTVVKRFGRWSSAIERALNASSADEDGGTAGVAVAV